MVSLKACADPSSVYDERVKQRGAAGALLAYGFDLGLPEVWAVTHLDNVGSARVCERLGLRLLGVTHRWYHEPLRMFWTGAPGTERPSLQPDAELPPS